MTLKRAVFIVPLIILGLTAAVQLLAILLLNDGQFVYSLDDPYIHLALAERLRGGHYGINIGEAAAPSSTILWPFLLAPFARLSFNHYLPLVINLALSAATLVIFAKICALAICPCERPRSFLAVGLMTVLLIPLSNLVGLAFTGMEHSLQIFLTSLAVLGLVDESRNGHVRWWLLAALILGPLTRYENLAFTVPALVYLALRKHTRAAMACAALIAVFMLGFSAFLSSLGLNPIPSSIRAKSFLAVSGGGGSQILGYIYANLADTQGVLLALGLLLLVLATLEGKRERSERLLAGLTSATIVFHFLGGDFDGYHRYELYIWSAASLMIIYLYRDQLRRLVLNKPVYQSILVLLFIAAIAGREYASVLVTNPLAANNIYQQQYQMHRFAADLYDEPVAVVDLGWVAYQNDNYVLDLWGLASEKALQERASGDSSWMNKLAEEKDVQLAMIYDFRFRQLPPNWTPIGALRLGRKRMSVADETVFFYALNGTTAEQVTPLLELFRQTLPDGVEFYLPD